MYRELTDLRLNSSSGDSNGQVLSKSKTHSDESQLNGIDVSSSAPAALPVKVVHPGAKEGRAFPSIAVTDTGASVKRTDSTMSHLTRHATVFMGDSVKTMESKV